MRDRYFLTLDAGGTMTDCYLSDKAGNGYIGKSLTVPDNQAESYLEAVADAAQEAGVIRSQVHATTQMVIYAGTTLTNLEQFSPQCIVRGGWTSCPSGPLYPLRTPTPPALW